MKTGPALQPMAERLQANLNFQSERGADSIKQTLQTFETGLAASLRSARTTIDKDIAAHRTELASTHAAWTE